MKKINKFVLYPVTTCLLATSLTACSNDKGNHGIIVSDMKLANISQVLIIKNLNLLKIIKKGHNSPLPPRLSVKSYIFSWFLYNSIIRA